MALTISAGKNTTACTRISATITSAPVTPSARSCACSASTSPETAWPSAVRSGSIAHTASAAATRAARVRSRRRRTALHGRARCRNPYRCEGQTPRRTPAAATARRGSRSEPGSMPATARSQPAHRRPPGRRHRRHRLAPARRRCSLLAGTGLLWADSRKDDDGYFSTSHERVADVHVRDRDRRPRDRRRLTLGDGLYGKAAPRGRRRQAGVRRHRPHARRRGLPPADSAHATLTDVEFRPFEPRLPQQSGHRGAPGRPGDADVLGRLDRGHGERS